MGMYLGYWFMLPLSFFLYRGHFTPLMRNRMLAILGLGAAQGGIGWWMVKSGLKEQPDYQNRPRVSPYRLMTHLMMATTLYAALLWHSFCLLIKPVAVEATDAVQLKNLRRSRIIGILLIKCLILNIFTGALVAGIDAGKV
jgi:cytochrome c oxidase assembly protein subunit 15